MNNKILIFLIVIILLLGLAIGYFALTLPKKPQIAEQNINLAEEAPAPLAPAVSPADFQPPESMEFLYFFNLAVAEENQDHCYRIQNMGQQRICLARYDELFKK